MRIPNIFRLLGLVVASVTLSACLHGTNPGVVAATKELTKCGKVAGDLPDSNRQEVQIVSLVKEADERLDVMLSCFIGPKPKDATGAIIAEPAVSDPITDAEVKALYDHYAGALKASPLSEDLLLYRGHLIIAVLARYGGFNATGKVGEINVGLPDIDAEDAMDILGAIHEAQYETRRSSNLFTADSFRKPYTGPSDTFAHVKLAYEKLQRIRRVGAVTELAGQAATPTVRRTLSFARQVASTIRTPTGSGVKDLFQRAKAGIEKLSLINHVGPAYLADVQVLLTQKHGATITKADWQELDKLIDEACERLSEVAGVNYDCTPGQYL